MQIVADFAWPCALRNRWGSAAKLEAGSGNDLDFRTSPRAAIRRCRSPQREDAAWAPSNGVAERQSHRRPVYRRTCLPRRGPLRGAQGRRASGRFRRSAKGNEAEGTIGGGPIGSSGSMALRTPRGHGRAALAVIWGGSDDRAYCVRYRLARLSLSGRSSRTRNTPSGSRSCSQRITARAAGRRTAPRRSACRREDSSLRPVYASPRKSQE